TTATRAETLLIERAMSSANPMTREDLMPGAGSSSYSVTTGPGCALMISPRTPKSPSTLSSARAFSSIVRSDARGFDAGRGLELVQRNDGSGMRVDDLAAHAKIAEHAFERTSVLLDR